MVRMAWFARGDADMCRRSHSHWKFGSCGKWSSSCRSGCMRSSAHARTKSGWQMGEPRRTILVYRTARIRISTTKFSSTARHQVCQYDVCNEDVQTHEVEKIISTQNPPPNNKRRFSTGRTHGKCSRASNTQGLSPAPHMLDHEQKALHTAFHVCRKVDLSSLLGRLMPIILHDVEPPHRSAATLQNTKTRRMPKIDPMEMPH